MTRLFSCSPVQVHCTSELMGVCLCSSRLALHRDETSVIILHIVSHGSFPIAIPPIATSNTYYGLC